MTCNGTIIHTIYFPFDKKITQFTHQDPTIEAYEVIYLYLYDIIIVPFTLLPKEKTFTLTHMCIYI
jgi:hypothetical protein